MAEHDAIAALTAIIHDARMAWTGGPGIADDDWDLDRHIAEAIAVAGRVVAESTGDNTRPAPGD